MVDREDLADRKDIPGVIAPPPLIALAAVLIGLLLDWLMPVYVLATLLKPWWCGFVGGILVASGFAIGIAGRQRFVEADTNVNPWKPALHLTTAGIYRYVRNPMYAGMLVVAGGIGVAFASDWTLVMIVPIALVLHYGVVVREERYLEAKFGEPYRQYKARAARWGIW
jgi:protein-S-isoprenylcysteine O-methyltransferase Ste14